MDFGWAILYWVVTKTYIQRIRAAGGGERGAPERRRTGLLCHRPFLGRGCQAGSHLLMSLCWISRWLMKSRGSCLKKNRQKHSNLKDLILGIGKDIPPYTSSSQAATERRRWKQFHKETTLPSAGANISPHCVMIFFQIKSNHCQPLFLFYCCWL